MGLLPFSASEWNWKCAVVPKDKLIASSVSRGRIRVKGADVPTDVLEGLGPRSP